MMVMLSTIRIYTQSGTRLKVSGFMRKITAPLLTHYLLREAKANGIYHAIIHNVNAGFFKGGKIIYSHYEIKTFTHPECLELIGGIDNLNKFINANLDQLRKSNAIISTAHEINYQSLNNTE